MCKNPCAGVFSSQLKIKVSPESLLNMKNYQHSGLTMECGAWAHRMPQFYTCKKNKIRDDPLYSLALKAEVNFIERESLNFNVFSKKVQPQCSYTGDIEKIPELNFQEKDKSDMAQKIQDSLQFTETE
ncbi:hypothetical protein V6Z11_A10G243000 [Gossypium hirsutum]